MEQEKGVIVRAEIPWHARASDSLLEHAAKGPGYLSIRVADARVWRGLHFYTAFAHIRRMCGRLRREVHPDTC